MSIASALLATILLAYFIRMLTLWSVFPGTENLWTAIGSIYTILLAVTGWGYVLMRRHFLGWSHAVLMFGVTGICAYLGFQVVADNSIAGGSGPDANPVAYISYALILLFSTLGIAAATCAVGVLYKMRRGKSK